MKTASAEQRKIRESFRMECVGAGMYTRLARQYRRHGPISEKFARFSGQEAMHGRLLSEYHRRNYGRALGGGRLWRAVGAILAIVMGPVPLKKKMKRISAIERRAVEDIRAILSGDGDEGFASIVKQILPDEVEHASLYVEIFHAVNN